MTKYTHELIDSNMAKISKLKAMFEQQKENVGKLERSLLRRKYALYTPQEFRKTLQLELAKISTDTISVQSAKGLHERKLSYIYGVNGDYGDYSHLIDFVKSIQVKDRSRLIKTGEINP
jgi:hypothetical protein